MELALIITSSNETEEKRECLANCDSAVEDSTRCREGQSTRGGSGGDLLQEAASIARTKLERKHSENARTKQQERERETARTKQRMERDRETARTKHHYQERERESARSC